MDSLFFWLSKLIWLFISPDSLLLICFALGLFFLWKGSIATAKKIFSTLLIVFLLIGFFPVGEWLLYPLESKYPVNPKLEKVDGIIVLGGAADAVRSDMWQQPVIGDAGERLFTFIQLAKEHPQAKRVFTGGSGSVVNQYLKGADVTKQLFIKQKLDISTILFERESRNTWENAVLSKELSKPQKGENWVLITTAWHMPRSVGIFCKAEWDVIPYPVDFATKPNKLLRVDWDFSVHLNKLRIGVKEWIGIIAYQFTGKMCR